MSAEDVVRASFRRLGLDPVEVSRTVSFPGAADVSAVHPLRVKKADGKVVAVFADRPLVHVKATFAQPSSDLL